jgi:hypothetical protein
MRRDFRQTNPFRELQFIITANCLKCISRLLFHIRQWPQCINPISYVPSAYIDSIQWMILVGGQQMFHWQVPPGDQFLILITLLPFM